MASDRLFYRDWELIVGEKVTTTNAAQEPPEGRSFKNRLTFNVESTSVAASNKAKIDIYNISPESRSFLEQRNLVVFLKAGYEGSISTIFFGDVIRRETSRNGPDVATTLECGDAENILSSANIQLGFDKGVTNIEIIQEAAAKLKLSTGIRKGITTKVFESGFSFSGRVTDLLTQLTRQTGTEHFIRSGELVILPVLEPDNQEAVLVTQDTGLVGFPTKTIDGLEFTSLLNPEIQPGRAVKVESKQFQGEFGTRAEIVASASLVASGDVLKTRKVIHEGDTAGGPWFTKVEGFAPGSGSLVS